MELKPLGINVTIVEPGYFRTDFLDAQSLTTTESTIADYAETVGEIRKLAVSLNHNQPGNPALLAKALLTIVDAPNPPLRIPFGSDTVAAIEAKHQQVSAELESWRALSVSTDFAASQS